MPMAVAVAVAVMALVAVLGTTRRAVVALGVMMGVAGIVGSGHRRKPRLGPAVNGRGRRSERRLGAGDYGPKRSAVGS